MSERLRAVVLVLGVAYTILTVAGLYALAVALLLVHNDAAPWSIAVTFVSLPPAGLLLAAVTYWVAERLDR